MFQILIVEDDLDQALVMRAVLAEGGMATRVCGDGVSGLAAVDEFRPDVVLLDVNLPDQDGFEVCRAIRQHEPPDGGPIVVMVTARTDTVSKLLGFAAGIDDYLAKPVDLRELRSRVPTGSLRRG